jgi:hypothetical protein
VLFDNDFVMRTQGEYAPIRYPTGTSGDFFVSGFAENEQSLYGTAVVADESVGMGRVIVFDVDPTYQGSTEGTERVLFNAVLGPDPKRPRGPAAGSRERAAAEAAARKAARKLPSWTSSISLTVRSADRAAATRLLREFGADFSAEEAGGRVRFAVDNPRELSLEEHPWALELAVRLRRDGVVPVSYRGR